MTQISLPRKLRVLIADDVQETRRNTRLMIAALDYAEVVAIASNGRQAVEMTEEQHPDIVILDVNMPEMDGLTAYKNIIKVHPDTGGIIISAEQNPIVAKAAASIGIQEFLVKPFFVDEMDAAIKRVSQRLRENRQKRALTKPKDENSEAYLEMLANEYMKEGRTDDAAVQIFERLAANPKSALRWLETLAMLYAIRREWGKLTSLTARLERETKDQKA
ncbi:MAG: Chemotaxis response regulator protein-glutamate methylesterase [Anaerolineales bacterium]|nr:Chemotaxis response regulator protein-glutamate methylesterase [Anaerolineales bacterium]